MWVILALGQGQVGRVACNGDKRPDNPHNTMANLHNTLTARFTDADEIRDIANHGASGGVNGFIWTQDCVEFFDNHEEEIYDYLNDCELSMKDFATQYSTIRSLKNDMVWAVVELWCQAQHMVNEMEAMAIAS
jgi:hypothetical protein